MIFHISYTVHTKEAETINGDISAEWTKGMNTLSDFDSFRAGVKESLIKRHPSWEAAVSDIVFLSMTRVIG